MGNYYQRYYATPKTPIPSKNVNAMFRDRYREPSNSQIKYYITLRDFLTEKEIDIPFMSPPRTKSDGVSKINALLSILRKNKLDDEFFKRSNIEHD